MNTVSKGGFHFGNFVGIFSSQAIKFVRLGTIFGVILRCHLGCLIHGKMTQGGYIQRNCIVVLLVVLCALMSSSLHAEEQDANPVRAEDQDAANKKEKAPGSERTPPNPCDLSEEPQTIQAIEAKMKNLPIAEQFKELRHERLSAQQAVEMCSAKSKELPDLLSKAKDDKQALLDRENDPPLALQYPNKQDFEKELTKAKLSLDQATQKRDEKKPGGSPDPLLDRKVYMVQAKVNQLQDIVDHFDQRRKEAEQEVKDTKDKSDAADTQIKNLIDLQKAVEQSHRRYNGQLTEIDDGLNQLFGSNDAANSFKWRMSLTFAVLVGLVILGFFLIAGSDVEIKKTIFSNESGIQFITLFAIVIAVILFGIINVLEGKELSALLGGLSGYILGRSKENGGQAAAPATSPSEKREVEKIPALQAPAPAR